MPLAARASVSSAVLLRTTRYIEGRSRPAVQWCRVAPSSTATSSPRRSTFSHLPSLSLTCNSRDGGFQIRGKLHSAMPSTAACRAMC
jgi:hypothetical protein